MSTKRLLKDYKELLENPIDYVLAHPLDENLLEWHYVLRGPNATPFSDGVYLGKLLFTNDFPLKAPAIYMITPNGKFRTNIRLCPLIDNTPEGWNSSLTVSTILLTLLSFMTDENCGPFSGSDIQSIDRQNELAQQSWSFNLNNEIFSKHFPQLVNEAKSLQNVFQKAISHKSENVQKVLYKEMTKIICDLRHALNKQSICLTFFEKQHKELVKRIQLLEYELSNEKHMRTQEFESSRREYEKQISDLKTRLNKTELRLKFERNSKEIGIKMIEQKDRKIENLENKLNELNDLEWTTRIPIDCQSQVSDDYEIL